MYFYPFALKFIVKHTIRTPYKHQIQYKMHIIGKILWKNCVYIRKNLYLCTRF